MNSMKKIKILFFLPVVLFMASCSEDTGMNTYPARGDEAFFDDTEFSYVVSAKMEDAYSVEVLRANKSGDASVGVTIEVANPAVKEAFTAPASVEFKDGEIASSVKISFDRSKLTIGEENEITVSLQSETDLPYATECKLVVVRDYTWKEYKKGTYVSGILSKLFGKVTSWEQPVEVAEEKPNLYRLKDWYHNAGTDFSDSGYDLTFLWDGGTSSEVSFTVPADAKGGVSFPTGWYHPSYGLVSMYIDTENAKYDSESKTFTFKCCGNVSLGTLIPWINDTFTLK